jgi:hypothetical protein
VSADATASDGTAVRVALWRALHLEVDAAPHVLTDDIGLRLAQPDSGWRSRGDMDPDGTRAFRVSTPRRSTGPGCRRSAWGSTWASTTGTATFSAPRSAA